MATSNDFLMDFRKEEKPEGGVHFKKGTYKAKIGKTKVIRSSQKGTIGLAVPFMLNVRGKKKKLVEKLWMSPKAYHRFRELLEACGKRVPKGSADIRRIGRAVEGEEIYINVVDDEQEGYDTKSTIAFQGGFISPDDYEDDDADEEDDDDLDDEDEEDEEDDDLDGDEDDDDEDEEDEEDEPSAKRSKSSSKRRAAPKKTTRRKKKASDDDDLDDLDLDDF